MADFTVTAANVVPSTAARDTLLAGEAITAGMAIYKKKSDGKAYKAQSDGTAEEATVIGIAINDAAAGQVVAYQKSGSLTFGSIFGGAGKVVCASNTAGAIAPSADVTTGRRLSIIGYTTSATAMTIDINNTGTTA